MKHIYIKSCCSMKELRKKIAGDENLKQAVMESVKPCRDILMERALQMSFAGLKIKESPTSLQADIDNLFQHIVAVDPTMTLEVTTKDTLKAHPVFLEWMTKHVHHTQYTFQIKNCGKGG